MATIKIAIENIGKEDLSRILNQIKNHNFPYTTFEELGIDDDAKIRLLCESEEDVEDSNVVIMWDMMEEELEKGFNVYDVNSILSCVKRFEIKEEEFAVIKEDTSQLILSMDMKNPKGMNAVIAKEYEVELDERYITLFKRENKDVVLKLDMTGGDVAKSIILNDYKLIVGPSIVDIIL